MSAGPPRSFELDRFQREAIEHLDSGRSVVVSAPTGSGKTLVAEHALALAQAAGRRGIYTTPIKALSNQKFRDLRDWLGLEHVGLLTGDNSINAEADVVVMTTEVLRNMLYSQPERLDSVGVVVMDEVHYLQDNYRGPVWEEVIIHLPARITVVALSATVSNADELAEWIGEVHNECAAVTETVRPVELRSTFVVGEKNDRSRLHRIPVLKKGKPNPEGRRFDTDRNIGRRSRHRHGRPPPRRRPWRTPRRAEVIIDLQRRDLLPAITFIFSRAGCDDAVRALRASGVALTDREEVRAVIDIIERRTAHLTDVDRAALDYDGWRAGLEAGIGAHHAGVIPVFKETVEELFTSGLLKAVFATETLALGINMPARTVVIEKLTKFTGEHHESLTPADFTQLTGRAGRRGIDDLGHAVVLWTRFTTFDEVAALARSRAFELKSAFRPTYNMACHLVSRYTRKQADELVSRSFGQFQADRAVAALDERRQALMRSLGTDSEVAADEGASTDALSVALSKLRPGEVIDLPPAVCVISVAWRRKAVSVRVIDADGEVHEVDVEALSTAPQAVASIDLPTAFNPNDVSHQHHLVGQLRSVKRQGRTAAPTPKAASPWRGSATSDQRRELKRIDLRMKQRRGRLSDRFGAVVGLLTELGYIDKWELTDRGERLLGTFHELDLVIVESLLDGYLDDHEPAVLAGVVSTFVFERRHSDERPDPWFPTAAARKAVLGIESCCHRVQQLESSYGLPETRDVDAGLFAATHGWTAGGGLGDILDEEGLTGGDFVRAMKQVLDVLSQLAIVAPVDSTRRAAQQAIELVQRGVVDAPFDGLETAGASS